MKNIADKNICSGCHACFSICPKNCITMVSDEEGFLYPSIDQDRCIDCGKCKKTCSVLNKANMNKGKAYACININEEIRRKSSSGGIFTLIAESTINKGGVVYGAAFDDDFNVKHIEVDNCKDLARLRGSKYAQSTIGDTYLTAKHELELGKCVLFSGTPCQIRGLKEFLGNKDYPNLITQDIICHGVPSPKVWKKYMKYREAISASTTQRTFFRNKKYGWKMFSVLFEFSNNTEYEQIFKEDLFMQGFLANLCLRPSCYNCHSKALERESDITLADFWGVENVCPQMFDDKGTSLVFVNTEKGQRLFDAIKENIKFCEVDIDEATRYNSAAYKSVKKPKKRDKFIHMVITEGDFEKAVRKYKNGGAIYRGLRFSKKCLKKTYKLICRK